MKKLKKSWLAVSVVVTSFVMAPQQGVAGDLRLTLVVYDHAHLSEAKLAEVENTTSEIFRRTGVQLVWIEGFGYAAKRRDVLTPAREDPATLVVKLQPESEAARYGVRSVCGGIGFASGAIIFVPRTDPTSAVSDVTRISHVIAHEIGHLILGSNPHSLVGIMRGTLFQEDWTKAAQGTLGFTRGQKRQMLEWLVKRNHRDEAPGNRPAGGDSQQQVRVHVFNIDAISAGLLTQSEMETSFVFRRAGIELSWMDGVVRAKEVLENAREHPSWDSMDLGLRIYTRVMVPEVHLEKNTLGFVIMPGTQASVLFDRVRQFASETESPIEFVLGATMAHEIFHLLTENNGHSRTGIMQAAWSRADMQAMAHGSLSFTSTEEDQLRGEISKRAQQNTATAGP